MTFLNLCNTSLIISMAFTVLISGLIIYLMNTKITRVEKNIQKQNQALSDIIHNIKNDVQNNNMSCLPNSLMAQQLYQGDILTDTNTSNKIAVSDDSESESESDSESDSGSESESCDDDNTNSNNAKKCNAANCCNDAVNCNVAAKCDDVDNNQEINTDLLRTINLTSLNDDTPHITNLTENTESSDDDSSESASSENNNINEIELKKVLDSAPAETENSDVVNVLKSFSVGEKNNSKTQNVTPGLTKLKVSELKDLVLTKNLASPNTTSDMKKKELIEILRNE